MPNSRHESKERLMAFLLGTCGLTEKELEMLGAFIVSWSFFEHELERAIWRLDNVDPTGIRPATDAMAAGQRVEEFKKVARNHEGEKWLELVDIVCELIGNAIVIRNAIAHGRILPGGGLIASNYPLNMEVRKRPYQDVYISDASLHILLSATYDLIVFVMAVSKSDLPPGQNQDLLSMWPKIYSANSGVGEVRYLAQCVNNEKY